MAQFHQTILSSLEEVENALVNFAKEKAPLALIDDQVQSVPLRVFAYTIRGHWGAATHTPMSRPAAVIVR